MDTISKDNMTEQTTTLQMELQQQMLENEKYITDLQKTDQQIQHKQYNIKSLFDIQFDDINMLNDKQLKAQNKMISKTITDNILLSNMLNENLISNIQNVNYNKYYTEKNVNLLEGNNPIQFCDNIIVFYILPTMSLKQSKQDQSLTVQKNIKLRDICKQYKLSNNLQMDVKHLRKPQQLNTKESSEKQQIQKILLDNPNIIEQYKQVLYNTKFDNYDKDISYYVMKIECQNIPFNELIENFNKAEQQLNKEGFYLFQIDITQDFLNNFDKQETIDYLQRQYSFRMQKQQLKAVHTILDNQDAVGENCLSYITNSYGFTTRHKLYNKFVCQLTSTSVQKKYFNNHLIDIFNSNTHNLKQSLQQAQETGLTRFEITVYNSRILRPQDYKDLINDQFNLFKDSNIFYKTPLQKQYQALEGYLSQSLIIIDNLQNKINCGLWSNYQTQQTIGQIIKFTQQNKQTKITESLQNFTFPSLPCFVLQINKIDNENISLDLQCQIRHQGHMLVQQNHKKRDDNMEEMFNNPNGLAQNIFNNIDNKYKWIIDNNLNKQIQVFNISKDIDKHILLLTTKQLNLLKKQLNSKTDELQLIHLHSDNKLIEEYRIIRQDQQLQKNSQKQQVQTILQSIQHVQESVNEYNNTLLDIFTQFKREIQFINTVTQKLEEGQTLIINVLCFKFINNIFYCLDQNLGVFSFSSTDKYNYTVLQNKLQEYRQNNKTFTLKQELRKQVNNKPDKEETYFTLFCANFNDLIQQQSCFTLEIKRNNQQEKYRFQNKSQLLQKVKKEELTHIIDYNKKEELQQIQQQLNKTDNLDKIHASIKNALKFKDLKENTNYIVQAIQQFNYTCGKIKDKIRYYLLIDNNVYISNVFFEKQIQQQYKHLTNDQQLSINDFNTVVQTIIMKTTETKNKDLNSIIRF